MNTQHNSLTERRVPASPILGIVRGGQVEIILLHPLEDTFQGLVATGPDWGHVVQARP